VTTKYTLPNHNISTNPVYIKAQANGDGTFKLLEPESTTLVSSSVSLWLMLAAPSSEAKPRSW